MTRKFDQPGRTIAFTVGAGGVESGDVVVIEDIIGVITKDGDENDVVEAAIQGVYKRIPADDGTDFANGQKLYWNDTDGKLYDADDGGTGDNHPYAGVCIGGKAEAADECALHLNFGGGS